MTGVLKLKSLVKMALDLVGLDGLANFELGCGCGGDSLMACGEPDLETCVAAQWFNCEECELKDAEEGCPYRAVHGEDVRGCFRPVAFVLGEEDRKEVQ